MSNEVHPTDDITHTDADLVALLQAGDELAMSQLVDRWLPAMFRVARSFVDSPQSAEDVVQEAWLGMLSGLASEALVHRRLILRHSLLLRKAQILTPSELLRRYVRPG